MLRPNEGAFELDMRVDIDPRGANSPVMDRVSGDIYQVFSYRWFGRRIRWRVYRRSWIVDEPHVLWSRCKVTITGRVRYWSGSNMQTKVRIEIPWGTFAPPRSARVWLLHAVGGTDEYDCERIGSAFRSVNLEVDVTQSADRGTRLPSYNTHDHATRPVALAQRDLGLSESYDEASIELNVRPATTIIDDSASTFNSWSPAELHDAMETHFSQIQRGWPNWELWGLLCGRYDNSAVGGIMFDAAAPYGGAGEAPERQGFAVFRDHSWFNDLPNGAPSNQDEAWALRQYLYTWVHEAGHAFNFLHSWNKSRPNSLSWMNYPQRVSGFWSSFELRFDDEELLHLRHGNRSAVIMGGDAWATGNHLEGDDPSDLGIAEGDVPLELLVRSKRHFAFMEEVRVELRLRNLLQDSELTVDARLAPHEGNVAIYVMAPDGKINELARIIHAGHEI